MTTIEQILNNPTDVLERMSDQELVDKLSPCFIFTRPEKQIPDRSKVSKSDNYKTAIANAVVADKTSGQAAFDHLTKLLGVKVK